MILLSDGMHVQMDPSDIESATILAFQYMFDSADLKGKEAREAFGSFVQLLAASHPVDRYCTASTISASMTSSTTAEEIPPQACVSADMCTT